MNAALAARNFTHGDPHLERYFQLFHWLHDVVGCCGICSADLAIIQCEKELGTNQAPARSKCQRPLTGPSPVCEGYARAAWKTMPPRPPGLPGREAT